MMAWWTTLRQLMRPTDVGQRGERIAAKWLKRRGFHIFERNRSVARDEADVIALDPDGRTLVIVEVKTRQSDIPPPEESIDHRKQHHLVRLAARLQQTERYRDHPVRFDVVAVILQQGEKPQVRHIPGAFESRW